MSLRDSHLRFPILLAAAIGIQACSSSSPPPPEVTLDPVEARVHPGVAAASITGSDMMDHIAFLASDELQGRDTPSPGLEKAAVYIEAAFTAAGLEPAGDSGSFVQRWTFERTSLRTDATQVQVDDGGEVRTLEYASDFFVLPSKDDSTSAELVFAGPIGVFLGDSRPRLEGGMAVVTTPPSMGMEILTAARAAGESGASGLVLILHPEVPSDVIGMVAGQIDGSGLPPQAVPTLGITWATGEAIASAAGIDLEAMAGEPETAGSAPLVPFDGVTATILTPRQRDTSTPPNVVGLIRGRDPALADTYVVLSAHFDHVGIGPPNAEGDSIYNGADDDASGTAVLLEVAQAFQNMQRPPARSVVFLAVSGEEKGLLGASHFAAHPTVPLEGIVANINMDMIGRNAPDTVIAIGEEYTSLGDLARRLAAEHPELGLTVAPDPDPSEQAFFRSDHLAFVKKDIPAIFFTTWDHEDYHQPSDEAHSIDADKAARVARLAFYMTWHVADDPRRPSWNEGALDEVHAMLEDSPF